MSEFVSSDGHRISAKESGQLWMTQGAHLRFIITASDVEALRQFFVKENDDRLGRWRWPENPEFVVYDRGDYVQVIYEPSGPSRILGSWTREQVANLTFEGSSFGSAAKAFFDAHPERKPAWHDAKPWETWLITVGGVERAVTLDEDLEFRDRRDISSYAWLSITSEEVTAGRRIWPEVQS